MENKRAPSLRRRTVAAAAGAFAGLAGAAAISRCSGGCAGCFACAVPGAAVLILAAVTRFSRRKSGETDSRREDFRYNPTDVTEESAQI